MIGAERQRRGWAEAGTLSVALHAAVLGWFVLPDRAAAPPAAPAPPLIELTAIPSPAPLTDALPPDTGPPDAPPDTPSPEAAASPASDAATSAVIAAQPLPEPRVIQPPEDRLLPAPPATGTGETLASAGPVLLPVRPAQPLGGAPSAPSLSGVAGAAEQTPPAPLPPDTLPSDPASAAAPSTTRADLPATNADPRLTPMFDRIRARLTEPCLLALPRIDDDTLHLAVLSDSDHNISALSAELMAGLRADTGRSAALLDPRQCPAIAFARRDPRYPVFPLTISVETPAVRDGETLRGRVQGASGRSLTVLLIDDNGVVHDLRPFLQISGTGAGFAVPLARVGRARDTQQLLVAVATDQRPRALSDSAGALAGPFFDRLSAEIGQQGLVGVASVLVQ